MRSASPFFATLLLFARIIPSDRTPTAATDGYTVYVNPGFVAGLAPAELDGVLLHEVLHCALSHATRRGDRDPTLWNVAADIVVNGEIARHGAFALPRGVLLVPALEAFSAEEVYELLLRQSYAVPELTMPDLLDFAEESPEEDGLAPEGLPGEPDAPRPRSAAELEAYWRAVRHQGRVVEELAAGGQGAEPGGLERELDVLRQGRLPWRRHLWRFLTRTPSDFSGFDRRFLGQGLYLDETDGESLDVAVAVDTSGSIGDEGLAGFLGELEGIRNAYPHVRVQLFYADAALYGPYDLARGDPPPRAQGGGGTSFVPFFAHLDRHPVRNRQRVAVYLTDGYGDFPEGRPRDPVLWVVCPGGLPDREFPFGEVVRMLG